MSMTKEEKEKSRQAIRNMLEDFDVLLYELKFTAKVKKATFDSLVSAGFTIGQALILTDLSMKNFSNPDESDNLSKLAEFTTKTMKQ
jgi:hypothetical protein